MLEHDSIAGPVNLTGPSPVTNTEFTETLGAVLHRPTVLPTPLLPLQLRYGKELVRRLLVDGQRVLPAKLLADGFGFEHPTLETALRGGARDTGSRVSARSGRFAIGALRYTSASR